MTRSHGRLSASSASGRRDGPAASTKERIIAAAVQTLREEGFAGTSARSIARHGGFNQALIFYHFGSVLDLLVAVLETMSADRLAQYRAAIADVPDLRTALSTARQQYETDVREGHITVLVELVAGASSAPQLGPEIVRCMEPWIGFAEESIAGFLGGTPLATIIPTREAAHALLAIYLGMELLDHLDPEADTSGPLFHVAERMLGAVEPFLGSRARTSQPSRRPPPAVVESAPATVPRSRAAARQSPRSRRRA
jgi:AcrR family transcriptional regulator